MTVEQLADGVYRVDAVPVGHAVSMLLLQDGQGWTLVDTGLASSASRVERALRSLGARPQDLRTIYLTHHHSDHVGGLPRLREMAPEAEIAAFWYEAEILGGQRERDAFTSAFMNRISRSEKLPVVPVVKSVNEGDLIGGFRVVATPGHTGGHTSLVSDRHGILFTADAFGRLPFKLRVGVRPSLCKDAGEAYRSAEKLLEESYEVVVFSHGPVLRSGAKARLERIVADAQR